MDLEGYGWGRTQGRGTLVTVAVLAVSHGKRNAGRAVWLTHQNSRCLYRIGVICIAYRIGPIRYD